MSKSKLLELCQKHGLNPPVYTLKKDGPDHCPRFTATVAVNGAPFQSPPNGCRSAKEAQNAAAKVAFDYLTTGAAPSPGPTAFPPYPVSPSLPRPPQVSSTIVAVRPTQDVLLQNNEGNIQSNFKVHAIPTGSNTIVAVGPTQEDSLNNSGGKIQIIDKVSVKPAASNTIVAVGPTQEDSLNNSGGKNQIIDKVHVKPAELLHVYKNRLLQYAQKNNLSNPAYTSEFEGPPHSRRFKASVTLDGRVHYKSSEYYLTLKDAEHAAAKVAMESLSTIETETSNGLFKTLLQELAQKHGYQIPSYSTNSSGEAHLPTFASTVEVGGVTYMGEECTTKKRSEFGAAKVAYETLINRIASLQHTSRKTVDENCENVGAKMTSINILKRTAGEAEGYSRIVAARTDGRLFAPIRGCGLIPDYSKAEAGSGVELPKNVLVLHGGTMLHRSEEI